MEIDKIYEGKTDPKLEFYRESIITTLRRQLWETQKQSQAYYDELQQLKKHARVTKIDELETQLKVYENECVRLRQKVKREILA